MKENKFFDKITDKKGKVLCAIACGKDLTKLEIKEKTSLSMTTVISAVDRLVEEGIITLEKISAERGGKPRSVINVRPECAVCGISYKGGALSACLADLGGGVLRSETREVKGCYPEEAVYPLAEEFLHEGKPLALALALNCEDRAGLIRRLEERIGVPVIPTSNTAAIAYRAYFEGGELPLAAIGIGKGVKCAFLEKSGCRLAEMGSLLSAPAFTAEGRFGDLLSASRVERTLCRADYRGHFLRENGITQETKELGEYSRALALSVAELAEIADKMLSPHEIYLFGEYLSEGFFRRIREASAISDKVRLVTQSPADFAYGTALAALAEGVFS